MIKLTMPTLVARRNFWLMILASLLMVSNAKAAALEIGDSGPGFSLLDIYGTTHSLSDYSGQPVVLFFIGYG